MSHSGRHEREDARKSVALVVTVHSTTSFQTVPVTLRALAKAPRGDPRFFTFPDGVAGVLLEATGQFFRLTEVPR